MVENRLEALALGLGCREEPPILGAEPSLAPEARHDEARGDQSSHTQANCQGQLGGARPSQLHAQLALVGLGALADLADTGADRVEDRLARARGKLGRGVARPALRRQVELAISALALPAGHGAAQVGHLGFQTRVNQGGQAGKILKAQRQPVLERSVLLAEGRVLGDQEAACCRLHLLEVGLEAGQRVGEALGLSRLLSDIVGPGVG